MSELEDRDERGRFAAGTSVGASSRFEPGNQAARVHGVRAFETRGDVPAELRQTVAAFRDGVVSDLGGAEELTTIQRAYVQRLTDVEVCCRLLVNDIAAKGLMTPRGRVRGTFSRFLEAVDRFDRLASRLGMARHAKPVDPHEAVRRAVEAANRR